MTSMPVTARTLYPAKVATIGERGQGHRPPYHRGAEARRGSRPRGAGAATEDDPVKVHIAPDREPQQRIVPRRRHGEVWLGNSGLAVVKRGGGEALVQVGAVLPQVGDGERQPSAGGRPVDFSGRRHATPSLLRTHAMSNRAHLPQDRDGREREAVAAASGAARATASTLRVDDVGRRRHRQPKGRRVGRYRRAGGTPAYHRG